MIRAPISLRARATGLRARLRVGRRARRGRLGAPSALARAPDLAAIAATALEQSMTAAGADAARVVLRHAGGGGAVIDSSRGLTCDELARDDLRAAARRGDMRSVEEATFEPAAPEDLAGTVAVRVDTEDRVVRGHLAVFWRATGVPPDHVAIQELVAIRASVAAAATRGGRLAVVAPPGAVDRLTGVRNRPTFEDDLVREVARASRHRTRLSLLLVDLDDFAAVNRSLGRAGADAVLAEVAGSLVATVRRSDEVGRLGPNRFGVILLESDATGATRVFDRVSSRLREGSGLTSVRVDACGGAATLGDDDARTLHARAAAALRSAKRRRGGAIDVAPPTNAPAVPGGFTTQGPRES